MTRFAWVLNLDADFELTRPGYSTSDRLRADLAKHGVGSRALLGPHDVIAEPGLVDPAAYVGRCWCPTPRALALLRACGVTPEPAPPVSVLRLVNHRHFAHALGGGLPEQYYVTTRAALDALLASDRAWMLKRPLTFAGRGQLRVSGALGPKLGSKLGSKDESWIDKSLRDDGLIVEPLVVPVLEMSLHGYVGRDGYTQLGVPCVQEVSERGVFRDARRALPGEMTASEQTALTNGALRVAQALADAGYFGPFGIDAYRYRVGTSTAFCALSEINARYTLGFAVGFGGSPVSF